jgi:hypothetical protein
LNQNKIEKAFVAVEASEKFKSLDTNLKEIVIGEIIQHISIFGHDAYLQDYLSNLHNFFEKAKEPNRIDKFKKTKEQFILNCILKELQLTDIESAENRKKIGEWLLNPKQQFVFHGFNGSFSEKIKQEGLSTDNRTYDVKKVNDMYNFLEDKIRKNHSVFGWYKINSEKKIFSGNNAENIYQYSINSPEWFSQFVAEGFHIDSSQNKNAFKERNYKDAKANVINFCDKNIRNEKFNEDDKNKILDFFEFFWPIFTKKNSKPMVAIMSIHDFLGIEIKDNSNINKDISKQSIMGLISSMDGDKDLSSKKSVPPKNITFVELPHI